MDWHNLKESPTDPFFVSSRNVQPQLADETKHGYVGDYISRLYLDPKVWLLSSESLVMRKRIRALESRISGMQSPRRSGD